MKKIAVFCILFQLSWMVQSQTTHVLFIGNSYTGANQLPQLTQSLALTTGDTLIIDFHTPGGTRLMHHASDPTVATKIASTSWDYVVLQAQSQEPSWPLAQVQTEVYPYAESLCNAIYANDSCTLPVFYMTWGRENGDAGNCPNWPPVCTYEGMDDLLRERYIQMASDNEALVSPVGAVWRNIRSNYPAINLYSADGSHPSIEGSYAAAATFYTIFLRKDPTFLGVAGGVNPTMAAAIQMAVKEVVYDSLAFWNVGDKDPNAVIDVNGFQQSHQVTFGNLSTHATHYLWNFGDGSTDTVATPTHVFPMGGNPDIFEVHLSAFGCSRVDTTSQTITIIPGGINGIRHPANEVIVQNPVRERIQIQSGLVTQNMEYEIYNLAGQRVQYGRTNGIIGVEKLSVGTYVLQLSGLNTVHTTLIIQR